MTLTVRLPETIESQLTRFCEAMGMSKSQVVLGALKDWFAKPEPTSQHPLLAFADAASSATHSTDWPGPYSKDRLRQQVLGSAAVLLAAEPAAAYTVDRTAPLPLAKVVKKGAKKVTKNSPTQALAAGSTDQG